MNSAYISFEAGSVGLRAYYIHLPRAHLSGCISACRLTFTCSLLLGQAPPSPVLPLLCSKGEKRTLDMVPGPRHCLLLLAASSRPNVTPNKLPPTLLTPAADAHEEGLRVPLAMATGAIIRCSHVNQAALCCANLDSGLPLRCSCNFFGSC